MLAAQDALALQIDQQLQRIQQCLTLEDNHLSKLNRSQLLEQYQQCKQRITDITALQEELNHLDKKLLLKHKSEQELNLQWHAIREQLSDHQKKLAIICEKEQQLLHDLPEKYRLTNSLHTAITQGEEKQARLEDQLLQAQESQKLQQQKLTQHQTSIKEKESYLNAINTDMGDQQKLWQQQLAASIFSDETAYASACLSAEQCEQLATILQHYNNQCVANTASIKTLQTQLKGKDSPDINALTDTFNQCNTQLIEQQTLWQQQEQTVKKLADLIQQLKKLDENNATLDQEYRVIGTLADAASGNNSRRLSLQRFVLSVLLDDVLMLASQRLQLMSKGRYTLMRKEERAKGNKPSGLELDVEDAYTGKTRSAATLSGGESFMAALSLALGLSDAVQAYAGGIKLDTLFIDEGFGSLDQESLDLAIKTLIDLQSSGRMIGIISHVSELKEQMALRIDVKTSPSGSHIVLAGH